MQTELNNERSGDPVSIQAEEKEPLISGSQSKIFR